ncbi:hypothetical protein [Xanthomonas prunicola]|uniref:Uncharacterized protein n=1 Tax=Xanthomonas prunicola TaxID=2053930 RepID=A0A9Q9IV80_9XANT|nr:hypothetical protein [Xanthomonas prunicola]UXA55037.1 hypothetical protein M0D45_10245 [Xanthomonas prunicola]UXA61528.1 hypothetical protein M0D48_00235 [Xanthomonas prunicola]UXA63744.1 hypothetical protein M0D43_12035 [Xanthomonas prunicola]
MWRIKWNRKLLFALTAVVVACIASNPELASLVPVLDTLGLDVFAYALAGQFGAMVLGRLMPGCRQSCMRWGGKLALALGCAFSCCIGGYLRQLSWYVRQTGCATVVASVRR